MGGSGYYQCEDGKDDVTHHYSTAPVGVDWVEIQGTLDQNEF